MRKVHILCSHNGHNIHVHVPSLYRVTVSRFVSSRELDLVISVLRYTTFCSERSFVSERNRSVDLYDKDRLCVKPKHTWPLSSNKLSNLPGSACILRSWKFEINGFQRTPLAFVCKNVPVKRRWMQQRTRQWWNGCMMRFDVIGSQKNAETKRTTSNTVTWQRYIYYVLEYATSIQQK